MSDRNTRDAAPALGESPRVSLLPPEVLQRAKARRTRSSAIGWVVLALIVAGVATAGATIYAITLEVNLKAAQDRTNVLLEQQGEFSEVRGVIASLNVAKQAMIVGGATEVDWKTWNAAALSGLPAGARVISIAVDSGTPNELFPAATVPLQGERVGSVTYEIATPTLQDLRAWLDTLPDVSGFVDATPTTAALDPLGVEYVSTTIIHFDATAYTLRFENEK